jgi:hypothetical protein
MGGMTILFFTLIFPITPGSNSLGYVVHGICTPPERMSADVPGPHLHRSRTGCTMCPLPSRELLTGKYLFSMQRDSGELFFWRL